jgi:hypothetical protein
VALLYKPFAAIARMLGVALGRRTFKAVWTEVGDPSDPPSPMEPEVGIWRAVGFAALRAATVATFITVLRRLSARLFHHLFGVWPSRSTDAED